MRKILYLLILLCCLTFLLCGCGNAKSKEKPSETELRKIVEEQAIDYKIDGNQLSLDFDSDVIGKYYFENGYDYSDEWVEGRHIPEKPSYEMLA